MRNNPELPMRPHRLLLPLLMSLLIGCQSQHAPQNRDQVQPRKPVPTTVPSQQTAAEAQTGDPAVMRFQAQMLESYAQAITNAPTREAQLSALQRLWQHMRDQNYTYDLKATRISDGAAVAAPATSTERLQIAMTIYQANRKLYDFTFQPIENQDLASLTQGGT
jgi:type IV pilus biogenesis protein CpaD/CtpE